MPKQASDNTVSGTVYTFDHECADETATKRI